MRKTTEPEGDLLERKTTAESFSDTAQGMTTFKTFVETKAVLYRYHIQGTRAICLV
ncbi:hypothetical protein I6N96_11380 [Enterococcus sp. BWM-S5]|uniref:Uncharacterized protein n=1 Tax=Enterococcus larvae TaxID=2794352 RepID=A0ABS4CLF2_9ENTE|nr:hypothetical protein [Enterococcus larvae]MBP1046870.1 hypothetical protein [Enterococcus larvae]